MEKTTTQGIHISAQERNMTVQMKSMPAEWMNTTSQSINTTIQWSNSTIEEINITEQTINMTAQERNLTDQTSVMTTPGIHTTTRGIHITTQGINTIQGSMSTLPWRSINRTDDITEAIDPYNKSGFPLNYNNNLLYEFTSVNLAGIVLNVLAFVLMAQPHIRKNSTSCYFSFLAVCDTLTLICSIVMRWYNPFLMPPGGCPLLFFVLLTSNHSSSWIVVSVAIERTLVILKPLKAKILLTRARAIRVCVAVVSVTAVSWSWLIWAMDSNGTCFPNKTFGPFTRYFRKYGIPILLVFIPSIILIVCTSIMLIMVLLYKVNLRQLAENQANFHLLAKTSRVVILVCLWFLATNVPRIIYTVIKSRNPYEDSSFINSLLELVMNLNYCCNLFLYILPSGQLRRAFIDMLKCKRNQVAPQNNYPLQG